MNTTVLVILGLLLVAAVFIATLHVSKKSASSPVQLHPAQGGGVCESPDWSKFRVDLMVAFINEGEGSLSAVNQNAFGHLFNKDYAGEKTRQEFESVKTGGNANQNTRDHYERFGQNYPSNISPC